MPVIQIKPRETNRAYNPGGISAAQRSEILDRENSQRRAREALAVYVRESALNLYDPEKGFLKKSGPAAADGYASWEEEDANLLREIADGLEGRDRELFYALSVPASETNRENASRWARAEQIRLSLGRIDAELTELGVKSYTGGAGVAERQALVYAARPAVERLSSEKARILGMPSESACLLQREGFAQVCASAIMAATDLDPVSAVPLIERLGRHLDSESLFMASEELSHALSLKLGVLLAENALSPGRATELAAWLIADSTLPETVKEIASGILRARTAKEARALRSRDIENILKAHEILEADGGDPSALPPTLFATLPNDARREILNGIARETDPREFTRLSWMAVNDPSLFADQDLTLTFDRLSIKDYRLFDSIRETLVSGGEPRLPERIVRAANKTSKGIEDAGKENKTVRGLMEFIAGTTGREHDADTLKKLLLLRELNETGRIDLAKAGLIAAELTGQAGKGA